MMYGPMNVKLYYLLSVGMKLGLSKGGKKAYLGIFALLGYYTAYDGSCLLTFWTDRLS